MRDAYNIKYKKYPEVAGNALECEGNHCFGEIFYDCSNLTRSRVPDFW